MYTSLKHGLVCDVCHDHFANRQAVLLVVVSCLLVQDETIKTTTLIEGCSGLVGGFSFINGPGGFDGKPYGLLSGFP